MKKIILVTLIFLTGKAIAQADTSLVQQNLETILEDASEGVDDSQLYDIIEYLTQNPIPLNTTSINDLLKIPFLDRVTAAAIIRHRNVLGGIYNIDQMRFIEDVSFELVQKIIPFVKLGDGQPPTFNEIFDENLQLFNLNFRTRGLYDFQKDKGFENGTYPDSRWKLYNRLIISRQSKLRLGALVEKDPGEKQLNDFTSFHFQMKNLDIIKNFVFGDYVFEFGQGLAIWSRYAFSKGSDAVEVLPRNSRGLVPYLSADENQFFRGVSAEANYENFSLSAFFSSRFLDASVDSTTQQITSLVIDGLHRTQTEISKKDKINERVAGLTLSYSFGESGNLGLLAYNTKYDHSFENQSVVEPGGSSFTYLSTSYNFFFEKVSLTGETAFRKKSFATLNSLDFAVDKNFSFLVSYRNYSEDYLNLHSNGFGERDFAQNENGFYIGARWKSIYGTINVYFDQFEFSYLSDRYRFPAQGNDFLVYYTFKPFKNTELRWRYKNEVKQQLTQVNDVYGLSSNRKQNLRGEFIYKLQKNLQLHSRIEFVASTPSAPLSRDNGYLIFQDIKYSPTEDLSFSTRFVFFQTDSYNSRVYEFENDLTGVMTNPGLYGEGMRWYFVAKYNAPYGFSISLKYAELYKPNEKFLGSGTMLIPGNLDNRLSLQMDYNL
ncbi:MAG: helix-hairpin-helix domain-containing protein [Ignavibacteriales bacterium]|nr:helix-hairpin-helix domain-containing protein [Ignavibacteriales bacterium]